jgi:hypothetical protein
MYIKSLGFAIVLVISLLTSSSFAQNRTEAKSINDLNTSALPNGSIVVIKTEETDSPGYVHTQYVFIDQSCGAVLVDHYGPPINPDDKELKRVEQQMCTELANNSGDGE